MPMALECFYPNDERNNGVWGLFGFFEEWTTSQFIYSKRGRGNKCKEYKKTFNPSALL